MAAQNKRNRKLSVHPEIFIQGMAHLVRHSKRVSQCLVCHKFVRDYLWACAVDDGTEYYVFVCLSCCDTLGKLEIGGEQ